MEFSEVARTRRSVHQYADEPIEEETLQSIFEVVRYAPSSFNLQPWELLVLREQADLRRLRAVAYDQEHVTDAAAAVTVFGDTDPTAHAERVVADQREKGYRDPADAEGALDSIRRKAELPESELVRWATTSASLAAMTLLYAAWDAGVATCPMGGFDADHLRETFEVPERLVPVLLVTMGYPADGAPDIERPRKYRRPVEEFVHFDDLSIGAE